MNIDLSKYQRQIILKEIGEEGQIKLFQSKILVIGAGGIGCPVLSYLTSAGVGVIGVLDYDKVEKNNLHRQVLYEESQVGIFKAEAAVNNLMKLNSETDFHIHNCFLNSKNGYDILKEYDIIVDASDNFKARYLINDICVILSKPFIMGAINKFEGQVAVLNFKDGPTYRCIYPEFPGTDSVRNCEENGVIGSLCGIVGTIIVTEIIKIITGSGDLLSGEVLFINSLNMEFRKIKVKRSPEAIKEALKLKEKLLT